MGLVNVILFAFSGILLSASAQLVIDENTPIRLFDTDLYERVLDPEECGRQVRYMQLRDLVLNIRFLDASARFPRGMTMLNVADMGHYHQCLGIKEQANEEMSIEGKYCFIRIPFDQNLHWPFLPPNNLQNLQTKYNLTNRKQVRFNNGIIHEKQAFYAPLIPDSDITSLEELILFAEFTFGICIPKVCSVQEWTSNVLFNVSAIGFEIKEDFCRLPDDKPLVGADYAAIVVFSLLGFITLISTMYDVNHVVLKKRDPKKANIFYRTFSVYTNTKRLLTFSPNANSLQCLDGIRSISMMWVVVGHIFSMYNFNANLTDAILWLTSGDAVWITTGVFVVDSFFLMAGLLLVYTSVGKMTGRQLLQRLHAFYINRYLRMFPLLAALVLLEASLYHRVGDGPYWEEMGGIVQNCRTFWWSTLLHVANYVNPDHVCVQHSWYLAIDIQLHLVSPLVLYWVLSKNKKAAWTALIVALLAIVTGSTIWNFIMEMPSSNTAIVRLDEQSYYMNNYYMVAWCRGAPFFVGMILGYILNLTKGKKVKLHMGFVLISWVITFGMFAAVFYTSYIIMQLDWDNQVGDSLFNSFSRVIWSIALSWIIFACVKGYGGPINWFLSLSLWKLPARISFAMYLYHYAICFIIAGMQLAPTYFSVGARIFDFLAVFSLSFALSFMVTVVVDAPFSILTKMLMEAGAKRKPRSDAANGNAKPELEQTVITTLDKTKPYAPYLERNDNYSEKNGPPMERNGHYSENNGIVRAEVGEPLPSKQS